MVPPLRRKIREMSSEAASIDLMGTPGLPSPESILIDDGRLLARLEAEGKRHLALIERFYAERYGARRPEHLEKFIQNAKTEKGKFWDSFGVPSLALLKAAGAGRGVKVLSLGSGIGTTEAAAARILGSDVTGIEYDPDYAKFAGESAAWFKSNGLASGRLDFREGDFMKHDFRGYDVLYYFQLGTDDPEALEEKVLKELKKGGRFAVYMYGHAHGYGFPKAAEKFQMTSVGVKDGGLTISAGAIFTHK